jgi:predicted DNA-binding transcriptional regulator AlpA
MRVRSIQNRIERPAPVTEERMATPSPAAALSEDEAARYLGMSRAWLKKSRTQRFRTAMDAPPFIRCGERRIVYRRNDLDEWQRQHLEAVGAASVEGP